jgi:hypothetical protein
MELAHASGVHLYQSRRNRDRRREDFGVRDSRGSAFRPDGVLRHQSMAEALWHRRRAGDPVGAERTRDRSGNI